MATPSARFRAATTEDRYELARPFRIASGGVADYMWGSRLAPKHPGLTPLEIGARRFAGEEGDFSHKNCVAAEQDGAVIGMLFAFPIGEGHEAEGDEPADPVLKSPTRSCRSRAASTSAPWRCSPGFAAGGRAQGCSP